MRWRTVLILLAAGALFTAINLADALRRTHARVEAARRDRLVPFSMREVRGFTIERPGQASVVCQKDPNGTWRVVEPIRDLLDRQVLEDVSSLVEFGRGEVQGPLPDAQSGLDHPSMHLAVQTAEAKASVAFGAATDDGYAVYARSDGSGSLWKVNAELIRVLKRPGADFRSPDLFPGNVNAAMAFEIQGVPGGTVTFRKEAEGWMLREPVAWPADGDSVQRILRRSAALQATRVLDEGPEAGREAFGADSIRLLVQDEKGLTAIRLGPPRTQEEEDGIAQTEGRPVLFAVPDRFRKLLVNTQADRYRKRSLDLLAAEEKQAALAAPKEKVGEKERLVLLQSRLSEIRIEQAGVQLRLVNQGLFWKGTSPEPFPADAQEVEGLVRMIRDLTIARFAEETQETTHGLTPPFLRLRVLDTGGRELVHLLVGDPAPRAERYAMLGNRPTVFTLSREAMEYLARPWYQWHERRLLAVHPKNVMQLGIFKNGIETHYRRIQGDAWQMVLPKTLPVDTWALYTGPLSDKGLGRLTALDIAAPAEGDLSKFGLDRPDIRVVMEYSLVPIPGVKDPPTGSGRIEIDVGLATEYEGKKAYYARIQGGRVVFLIKESVVAMLGKDYIDPDFLP
ncbi:MAG: DUF4340 domain-containing protein [Planctomycetota bacterium]